MIYLCLYYEIRYIMLFFSEKLNLPEVIENEIVSYTTPNEPSPTAKLILSAWKIEDIRNAQDWAKDRYDGFEDGDECIKFGGRFGYFPGRVEELLDNFKYEGWKPSSRGPRFFNGKFMYWGSTHGHWESIPNFIVTKPQVQHRSLDLAIYHLNHNLWNLGHDERILSVLDKSKILDRLLRVKKEYDNRHKIEIY